MVEEIKQLCQRNHTNLKALEQALGFGNGTIRRWDTQAPSMERVMKVAQYFGVPVGQITGRCAPAENWEAEVLSLLKALSEEELAREIAYLRERAGKGR